MKIKAEDIESFRWFVDDHLDELTTTVQQYKEICLEDESLALESENVLHIMKQAQELLDKASIEMTEVGMRLFGENL